MQLLNLVLYSILNYVPYMLLGVYAFRNRFRFSRRNTYLLIAVSTILQIVLSVYIATNSQYTEFFNYLKTILNIAFFFLAIKVTTGKLLFTLFMLTNVGNFVVCLSKCVEGYLFPASKGYGYHYSYTLILFLVELPVLYGVFHYVKISFTSILRDAIDTQVWNKIWLIPAFFYLIWYYLFFHLTAIKGLFLALMPSVAFFSGLLLVCQFLCYEIALSLALSRSNSVLLEQQQGNYQILSKEFQQLKEDINNARRANHDLRHHLTVFSEQINAGNYSELSAYLDTLLKNVPQTAVKFFCEHPIINLLLAHTSNIADKNDITFDVQVCFPASLPFTDNDLTIIFANFLENAIHACEEQRDSAPSIKIRGYVNDNYLICTIDNTYEREPVKNSSGIFITTKQNGHGIGIESARHVIEKYNGVLKINTQCKMFCVSIMMPLMSS